MRDGSLAALQSGHIKAARFKFDRPVFSTKTAILNSGQVMAPADRVSSIISPQERKLSIRDLLPIIKTDSNAVEYTREVTFVSGAQPQFSASPLETEGVLKGESAFSFSLTSTPVITIATWVPVSKQVLSDAPALLDFIDRRLKYALMLEEEDELLNGVTANGELNGLLAPGNFTSYNRSSSSDMALDTLRRAFTQLQLNNHTPTGVVLNPANWESISLLKNTLGNYLVGDPAAGNSAMLWGVPVIPTASMAANTFLVGDFANSAQLFQREEAIIEIGVQHADYFVRNMVAVLVEERLALAVYRSTGLVRTLALAAK